MKKLIYILFAAILSFTALAQTTIGKKELPPQSGHAGQFLKTNGSVVSWTAIPTPTYAPGISAALTGSGTVNYLSKYSSANTLTPSIVYEDGNNIGLGLTSTSAKLHAKGTGSTSATYVAKFDNSAVNILGIRDDGLIETGHFGGGSSIKMGFAILGYNSGTDNTSFGSAAMRSSIGTGGANSSFGSAALRELTNGENNCGFGALALLVNTIGSRNNAFGASALQSNTTGNSNIGIGYRSLFTNSTGGGNVAIGGDATLYTSNGDLNVALGYYAGQANNGSGNIFIGSYAGAYRTADSDRLFIDNQSRGSAANDLTKSLIVGKFAADPANQTFKINAKYINFSYLPTSSTGLSTGDLWNNSGVLNIVP